MRGEVLVLIVCFCPSVCLSVTVLADATGTWRAKVSTESTGRNKQIKHRNFAKNVYFESYDSF